MTWYGGWDFGGRVPTNPDENSRIAAESVEPIAPNQRAAIWLLLWEKGPLATWQLEDLTGGLHRSVSATVNWLHNAGAIVRTGQKNLTPSGPPGVAVSSGRGRRPRTAPCGVPDVLHTPHRS